MRSALLHLHYAHRAVDPFEHIGPADQAEPRRTQFDRTSRRPSTHRVTLVAQQLHKGSAPRDTGPAEHASFADLLAVAGPATSWTLRFRSPTTFRFNTDGIHRSFPVPLADLVYADLGRRWDAFAAGVALPDAVLGVVTDHLVLNRYDLKTRMHLTKVGGGALAGCVGAGTYQAVQPASASQAGLAGVSALTLFSRYAGVGDQTSKGMGWVTPDT